MYLRILVTRGRLLAVALLLAGSSLDAGSRALSRPDQQVSSWAAVVNSQVGSAEVPHSLQLYRSRSEQVPITQVVSDEDGVLKRNSSLRGGAEPCGLEGWRTALGKPLCEQALHLRSGVLLS